MSNKLAIFLSTFFYVGFLPLAPGSAATLVGCGLAYMLKDNLPIYVLVWAVITVVGFVSSDKTEKAMKQKDPGEIVIDEVSGCMLAFFLLKPFTFPVAITAFFLFRAFDM